VNFGILVFDEVEELDFVGPWEMLTMWSKAAGGPGNCLIVAQEARPVLCAKGLSINPHVSFADCPRLDWLLVPGGMGTRREVDNPVLVEFVAAQARHCKAVLSVCTGAFVLHAAGLLSGRSATTHWASLDRLRALGDVKVVEARHVQDGKVWTSAGVSAGIDLMLAFIASEAGDDVAGKVQFRSEYYPSAVRYGDYAGHAQAPAYLKASPAKQPARGGRQALLVIDVQQGLCEGEHAAFEADQVIARINQASARARAAGVPVIFVQHESTAGYLEFQTDAWQLARGLQVEPMDLRLRKTSADAFHRTDLQLLLDEQGVGELVICGMHTEFCVDTTTRRALALGYPVQLVEDAHTSEGNRELSASQVIRHHNETLTNISSFGPRVRAVPAADLRFGP
jgi:nicotinamidase-related amidase/putative intracellular protease/amidase